MRERHAGTCRGMTTVLPYVLAVLLVPLAISLMLFVMGRMEDERPAAPKAQPR